MIKPGDKIIDEKSGKELVAVKSNSMYCNSCSYNHKSCMHIDCVDLDSSSNVYGVILIEADKTNKVNADDLVYLQDAVNIFCKVCDTTKDSGMCKIFIEKLKGKLYDKQN